MTLEWSAVDARLQDATPGILRPCIRYLSSLLQLPLVPAAEYQGEAPWATAWRQKMRLSLDRAALSGSQESSPKISAAVATEVSAAQEPLLRPTLSGQLALMLFTSVSRLCH